MLIGFMGEQDTLRPQFPYTAALAFMLRKLFAFC